MIQSLHRRATRAILLVLACGAGAVAFACNDGTPDTPCREIPPDGCPAYGSKTCDDPSCFNIFQCVLGEWSYDHACPAHDGDASFDAQPPLDAHRGSQLIDASGIDAPPGAGGGPGCADLQMPDCPLALALACSSGDCCGCDSLFVCEGGGWTAWGSCADGGVTQK